MCIEQILNFINSTFSTALIGSLAGAFAGAYGGQYIVEKSKTKESLLAEIRNTNAAIMLVHDIFSSYFSLKKQIVKPLKDGYEKLTKELSQFNFDKEQGKIPRAEVFHCNPELNTLEAIFVPIDVLQKLVFEKISLNGKPLSAITTLIRRVKSLHTSIRKYNLLIELFKVDMQIPNNASNRYFGLPDNKGNIDNTYPTYVRFIYEQTDECIFFSKFLGELLMAHGEQLIKKFGTNAPLINKIDFDSITGPALMPD